MTGDGEPGAASNVEEPIAPGTASSRGAPGTASLPGVPVAAVDCGTNSTRLLVAGPDGAVLDRRMQVTRLGQGVDATHRLDPRAIDRTVAVLRDYRQVMDRFGVGRVRLVATSAARDAVNAELFFEQVEAVTGVRPELLSGSDEGRLSFAGATARLPAAFDVASPVLVVDIGGGSTELAVGTPAGESSAAISVDVGCVRVTERVLTDDPPTSAQLDEARRAVRVEVERARRALPRPGPGGWLVGLAGTVSTLSMLVHRTAVYERRLVHHSVVSLAEVEEWLGRLAGEPAGARARRPGMVEGREDVIVGGVVVLAEVMAVFERSRCLVSEDDILDGLAASLMAGG
ncbi:MAG: Ppx/GppA phosphatase family protein [Actinomycetota bacterium]|nr:Ppx/GppA phosphatase family protein [Actinomycetota bacterium]